MDGGLSGEVGGPLGTRYIVLGGAGVRCTRCTCGVRCTSVSVRCVHNAETAHYYVPNKPEPTNSFLSFFFNRLTF